MGINVIPEAHASVMCDNIDFPFKELCNIAERIIPCKVTDDYTWTCPKDVPITR